MKYFLPVATIVLAAGGLVLWLVADLLVPGMALMALALLGWALAPGVIGRLGTSHEPGSKIDARAVREHRKENPNTTIADGVRATQL